MLFLVATTSLPAVDRPNADCWNAARSRQKFQARTQEEKDSVQNRKAVIQRRFREELSLVVDRPKQGF